MIALRALPTLKQTDTTVRRLTDDMRRDWVKKGYIHLKGALTRDQVAGYLAATDEVVAKYREIHPEARDQDAFNIIQTVEQSPDFDSLIDHPSTFGVIVDLMGPYLQIMGTVIYVRYPSEDMPFDWHTDGGPSLREFRVSPDSRPLNFKIQYFLTDIPADNRANFCFVPGSHRRDFPEEGFAKGEWPEGGVQLGRRGWRCRHLHLRPVARRGPERGRGCPAQRYLSLRAAMVPTVGPTRRHHPKCWRA